MIPSQLYQVFWSLYISALLLHSALRVDDYYDVIALAHLKLVLFPLATLLVIGERRYSLNTTWLVYSRLRASPTSGYCILQNFQLSPNSAGVRSYKTLSTTSSALRKFLFLPHWKHLHNGGSEAHAAHLEAFVRFLTRACAMKDGRITVVAIPQADHEQIVAFAAWLRPHKRLHPWQIRTLLQSGVLKVLKGWGLGIFKSTLFDFSRPSKKSFKNYYMSKQLDESPGDTWHLLVAATDPDFEGNSYIAKLCGEAFHYRSRATYTLEATTEKARDEYAAVGFQLVEELVAGRGEVNGQGFSTTNPSQATGVRFWTMIRQHQPDGFS